MISDEYFENLYSDLSEKNEVFVGDILSQVKSQADRLAKDPSYNISLTREQTKVLRRWAEHNKDMKAWVDDNLPKAYKKGLEGVEGATLNAGQFLDIPMFGGDFGEISDKARQALKDIPEHHNMYSVFQRAAYDDFERTRLPVVRSTMDTVRELSLQATDEAYRTADELTRRDLSQRILDDFAKKNIDGVVYSDGRKMNIDSYTEMVARTQTGNASRQAHMNRIQEYGGDLVLISQHYPVSPLCSPYQGRAYSISGESNVYPSLQSAIDGGLYHANCKHSQSQYKHGQKIPEAREKVGSAENKRRYEASQRQRQIERRIKYFKRKKSVALTEDAQKNAQQFISKWQKEARSNIESNPYLKRKYFREQI